MGAALITQMGEQADYLRFMPRRAGTARALVAGGGHGRAGLGAAGVRRCWADAAGLAGLSRHHARTRGRSEPDVPAGWLETLLPNVGWAVWATVLLVVVSQLKINVTNAYAGSLAWSNFFSRLTHSHPGRGGGWCSTRRSR